MKYALFSFAAALCLVPAFALAHNDGLSFEKQVGNYFVDVGYGEPVAGKPIVFDFALEKNEAEQAFDTVWVRLQGEDGVVFAAPIDQGQFGKPTASVFLPKPGAYTISVRFERAGNALAETEFPFTAESGDVSADPGASGHGMPIFAIIALAVAACAGGFLLRGLI